VAAITKHPFSEATMTKDTQVRIDLTGDDQHQVEEVLNEKPQTHELGFQILEHRIVPLVVIAIIAILIGLLLPA
jgi:hypothetical protein